MKTFNKSVIKITGVTFLFMAIVTMLSAQNAKVDWGKQMGGA
ncbi:MAG: hypothetical protein NTX03_07905 [Bacteroidetes bacterium]|nr:hypothetical protein [Bacteroidota bacterium]